MNVSDDLDSDNSSAFFEECQSSADDGSPKSTVIDTKRNVHVFLSMTVVLSMITATAAVVIGLTFAFLSQEEQEDFQHGVSTHRFACLCRVRRRECDRMHSRLHILPL